MLRMVTLAFVNYRVYQKRAKINIHEYSLCFIVEKTFEEELLSYSIGTII